MSNIMGNMNSKLKFVVIAAAVIVAVGFVVNIITRPTVVSIVEVTNQLAEVSFSEQGVVVAENTVRVFAAVQGELNGLYVREGQEVQEGDILVRIDDSSLQTRLSQVENIIRSIRAQLGGLDTEEARAIAELQAARSSLQGELQALIAQAEDQDRNLEAQHEVLNERMRIQNAIIEQNQADTDRAAEELNRVESLFNSGIATRIELDAAQNALERAETRLESSRHELNLIAAGDIQIGREHFDGLRTSITARISGIEQQLAQDFTGSTAAHLNYLIAIEEANIEQLQRDIQNSVVSAPVSGIITTLQAQGTNFISQAMPVAEIMVPGGRYLEAYVPTEYVNSINVGDEVSITLNQWAGDIKFSGQISEIGDTASVRFTFMGVEERMVNVRIAPNVPAGVHLGIGYGVDVTFYVYQEPNRLIIPESALFSHENAYAVWVLDNSGTIRARPVETGIELESYVVITSGLSEGEFIVEDADNRSLSEGMAVRGE